VKDEWRQRHADRAKQRLEEHKLRVQTVADYKGKHGGKTHGSLPSEGSRIRALYDLFKENAGYPLEFERMNKKERTKFQTTIQQLMDFYGCDIRSLGRQGVMGYGPRYILVGEWDGPKYIDYLAERAAKEDK
jgi:hypothetical protein